MSTPPPPNQGPGWRPDTLGRHEYRYHDGSQWTAAVSDNGVQGTDPVQIGAPPTQPAVVAKAGKIAFQSPVYLWGVASVVLLAIGSLGPWATIGAFSVSGTSNGRDGIVTLVLAGIAAIALAFRRWPWSMLIVGLLALATTVYDIADISNRGTALLAPSLGWGLILAAVAAASLCIWPFFARNQRG